MKRVAVEAGSRIEAVTARALEPVERGDSSFVRGGAGNAGGEIVAIGRRLGEEHGIPTSVDVLADGVFFDPDVTT
jgi:hypothetical protein